MIFYFGKWIERLKFIALFLALTFLLYHLLHLASDWMEPWDKYKEPAGNAVKVFGNGPNEQADWTLRDRLKLFYWYGE